MMGAKKTRRLFLRGLGGAAIALPLLDIMLDENGTAYAGGGALPRRYLLCFGGFSLGADGINDPQQYIPDTIGPGYDLKAALAPLAGHGSVKDHITVVSGLRVDFAQSGETPAPGGFNVGFHHSHNSLLAGLTTDSSNVWDASVHGPSSDQVVAAAVGDQTLFRSLTYRVQALFYNQNNSNNPAETQLNRDTAAFTQNGTPIPPQTSPRQAYDALFLSFVPGDPDAAAAKAKALAKRSSILDLVDRRMDGLLQRLGAADKQRLEAHLTELRELERRLQAAPPGAVSPECSQFADPGADPPLGTEFSDHSNYDVNQGWSDEDARALRFTDLLHMAFTCDLTRAASLMYTMGGSNMNAYPLNSFQQTVHGCHHSLGNSTAVAGAIAWHMDHFGRLVAKLRDTPEGAGSVLDNCAIIFMNEGGHGSSWEGESSHSGDNMACLVAGRAGGWARPGEHIVAPAGLEHPANVMISAMNAVGLGVTRHGDITGVIPELMG
jgi:hypothetical protein